MSWWPGDGNANDVQAGNNGTLQGSVGFVAGEVGQAFSFAGVDGGGVLIGNPTNLQLQDFTIDAWVRRTRLDIAGSHPPTFDGVIVNHGHDAYDFGLFPDGEILLSQVDESFVSSGSGLQVTDTNFHHVAVTKAGSKVVFYVDGTPGVPITYGPVFAFTKNLSLGARLDVSAPTASTSTATFAGVLDEIEIFNRALTAGEIQAIFAARSAGKCKGRTSTTTTTTSSPPTTTTPPPPITTTTRVPTTSTTSTTTLPCTTARCTLQAALMSPACAGQTIPASVTGKLNTAETLIDQAATTAGKKARKVRQRARNLLRQAGAKATRAAKGKKPKLSPACAAALKDAAGRVAAGL